MTLDAAVETAASEIAEQHEGKPYDLTHALRHLAIDEILGCEVTDNATVEAALLRALVARGVEVI